MRWFKISEEIKPQISRIVICYCPDWCPTGYQIARWNGKEFRYEDQPNEMFNSYVKEWTIFLEAD